MPETKSTRKKPTSKMTPELIRNRVETSLDEIKARDMVMLDVHEVSSMTDFMIICSGTSDRHVKSIANRVMMDAKEVGIEIIGVEGQEGGQWVLIDLGDVVCHVMRAETREFYQLEKLWEMGAEAVEAARGQAS